MSGRPIPVAATPRPSRIALVIGAGAVKCAAALGLWRVLRRNDIEVDLLVGCSGGSLYAAVMALGFDLETCERLTRQLWTRKVMERRDHRSILAAMFPRMFGFDGRFGLVHDGPISDALRPVFDGKRFEHARTPFHVVATDFSNGERVVLSDGPIFDALRASISIPYVWRPWKIGDRWLVDGCLSDPLPIDVAMREGADLILAMGFESAYPRKVKSVTRFAFQISSIYTNNLLRANFAFHNAVHHSEIIPIVPEFDRPIGLFDTDKFPHVIEQGEKAAEAQMPYLLRLLGRAAGAAPAADATLPPPPAAPPARVVD